MSEPKSEAVSRAKKIIAGAAVREPGEYRELAKELEHERELSLARRLLQLGRRDPEVDKDEALLADLTTAEAVLTYKDPELPAEERLDEAWELLRSLKGRYNLSTTEDQEVLGIAGAIWKYRFELS